jgi:predicted  nucleic acid-binding Zn-ribbon protein
MKGEVEMILSDEEIKVDDWGTYTVFKQSHLEANARIRELEAKLLEIGTALGMADNLGTIIEYGAIHAKDLSDDLSRVNQRKMELWVKLQGLREIIERNSKDLPSEFSQLLDDHFWEIAQAEKETK